MVEFVSDEGRMRLLVPFHVLAAEGMQRSLVDSVADYYANQAEDVVLQVNYKSEAAGQY